LLEEEAKLPGMEVGVGAREIPLLPYPNPPRCSFSDRVLWVFGDSGKSLENKSIYLRGEKAGILYTPAFFIIHSPIIFDPQLLFQLKIRGSNAHVSLSN
jgi:hypothetical protein